jgi:hypothetical protein
LLIAGLLPLAPAAGAEDERRPSAEGDRMAAIVAAVRAEEAKYRDIEYVARIVIRDTARKDPADSADVTTLATRRVVFLRDRNYIQYEAFERMPGVKSRRELISAYDGERTRTVATGNCVNIHLGRFIHPEISPAHGLPLAHFQINFPLSVYLSGTEAIHAYQKYPRELVEAGSADVFARVNIQVDGEEPINNLRCLKVRVNRWYSPQDQPLTQYLWLAPERNYHCVMERYLCADMRLWHDMRVAELRELVPGVWFPTKFTVTEFDIQRPAQANPIVVKRTETIIERVELAPHYEDAFFRDVAIPADLPVFTIKDRTLAGSKLPEPADGDREPTKLLKIAARVAEQEKRYDDIEVNAHVRYNIVNPLLYQWHPLAKEAWQDRSVVRGNLAYHTTSRMQASANGWQRSGYQVNASDGCWSRMLWGADPENPQGLGVILRRGQAKKDDGLRDGVFVYRPHTLMMRDQWIFSPLADLLASSRFDRIGQTTLQFRYCGTAEVDGHLCVKIRGDFTSTRDRQLHYALVLYLATDRNEIPIKQEFYAHNLGRNLIPDNVDRCADFREIAPGLWYPFRVIELGLGVKAHMGQEWILVSWQRDSTIDSVTLAPNVDESVFRDVIVPAGATV